MREFVCVAFGVIASAIVFCMIVAIWEEDIMEVVAWGVAAIMTTFAFTLTIRE